MAAARPLPMPSPAAPAPVTIATLSCRPQLSGTSKRCASAMSSSGGGFYHPPSWPSRGGRLERVASAERHAQHADRVRRELVLEPVAPRGEPRLAHVDGARGLEQLVASTEAPLTSATRTSSFTAASPSSTEARWARSRSRAAGVDSVAGDDRALRRGALQQLAHGAHRARVLQQHGGVPRL